MAKDIKNENAEAVAEAVSKTEKFFNKNGKLLMGVLIGIVVAAIAAFGWFKFSYQPAVAEAQGQMALAEQNALAGDFEAALNGNGDALGFYQIIAEYGSKAGEVVYMYAGVIELQNGNYQAAIDLLKEDDGDDAILEARALACIGDAYVGLENYEEALKYFEDAAEVIDNVYAAGYLFKAGLVAEKLGKNDKALELYELIKDQYPHSQEGYDIDKYIGRLENK